MIAHDLAAAAFERSPVGMLVVNRAGTIVAVNGELERMLGYDRNELVGQNVDLLVPLSRAEGHAAMRESYMNELAVRPMGAGRDLVARHRDGQEVPVEIGLSSVELNGSNFVLCSIADISARRQLEDRLPQTQKLEAIGTLAGGIASRIEVDARAPESADTVRCRILFVDDEVRLAQLGQRLLAGEGFDVDAYSSSLQALSEFNSNPDKYDLVITDNKMPHLAGIELADAIRKIRPTIPILMVSGNGETIDPNELSRRGVRRLIAKPYAFSDLREVVMELINEQAD